MQKALIQLFLGLHMFLYRLTDGRVGGKMGKVTMLVLTSRGRKSGQERAVPLTYFQDGSEMVLIASNGGQPTNPAWYHNLKANPRAQVQVMDRQFAVQAEEASPEHARELWPRILAAYPNYRGYAQKTTRQIPLMRLKKAG